MLSSKYKITLFLTPALLESIAQMGALFDIFRYRFGFSDALKPTDCGRQVFNPFRKSLMSKKLVFLTVLGLFLAVPTLGSDWPQWRGPGRDGIWPEKGIVRKFDTPQLNIRWRAKIANGYSGPITTCSLLQYRHRHRYLRRRR